MVPINDKNEVMMVRQYRKAIEKELLEIPAGKLERGESKVLCAERELMEEIGYYPGELKHISSFFTSPGFSNEIIHLFLAKKLIKKSKEGDFDEFLQLEKVPIREAIRKIHDGEIMDGKTIVGLLLTLPIIQGGF